MVPLFSIPRGLIAENPFTSLLLCSCMPSTVVASGTSVISWCQQLTIEVIAFFSVPLIFTDQLKSCKSGFCFIGLGLGGFLHCTLIFDFHSSVRLSNWFACICFSVLCVHHREHRVLFSPLIKSSLLIQKKKNKKKMKFL